MNPKISLDIAPTSPYAILLQWDDSTPVAAVKPSMLIGLAGWCANRKRLITQNISVNCSYWIAYYDKKGQLSPIYATK